MKFGIDHKEYCRLNILGFHYVIVQSIWVESHASECSLNRIDAYGVLE